MIFFSSATRSTLFDDNVLALWINVLTTAALCATGWCKSKDTYWLVCVAFPNTEVVRDPSSTLCRHTSKTVASLLPPPPQWIGCTVQCCSGGSEDAAPGHGGGLWMCHSHSIAKSGEGSERWLTLSPQHPPLTLNLYGHFDDVWSRIALSSPPSPPPYFLEPHLTTFD